MKSASVFPVIFLHRRGSILKKRWWKYRIPGSFHPVTAVPAQDLRAGAHPGSQTIVLGVRKWYISGCYSENWTGVYFMEAQVNQDEFKANHQKYSGLAY
jgi:hypothetical protein